MITYIIGLLVFAVSAAGSSTCLYCKHQDTTAGLFYSYSYCKPDDKCYDDVWNRMNAWCTESWIEGYQLSLESECNATPGMCQNFVSTGEFASKNLTGTRSLQAGEYCTITIDATAYQAQVLFDQNDDLGVMYNGYRTGTFLKVE